MHSIGLRHFLLRLASVSRNIFLSTMLRTLYIKKQLYVIQISQMRFTMIWENNNPAFISCFLKIKLHCNPNNDITPTFSDVTASAISASDYPGIKSSLTCTTAVTSPLQLVFNCSVLLQYGNSPLVALYFNITIYLMSISYILIWINKTTNNKHYAVERCRRLFN